MAAPTPILPADSDDPNDLSRRTRMWRILDQKAIRYKAQADCRVKQKLLGKQPGTAPSSASRNEISPAERRARNHTRDDGGPAIVGGRGGAHDGADRRHFVVVEPARATRPVQSEGEKLLGNIVVVG